MQSKIIKNLRSWLNFINPTADRGHFCQQTQQWVRRLDSLIANKNQENNRLDEASEAVAINISTHIEFLDKQIKEVEELISNHIKGHKDLNDKSKLDTGLIFQDKFLLILLPFLSVAFKRHFVNNHDKHSLVFDNQCSNEIFDYYIYPCSY